MNKNLLVLSKLLNHDSVEITAAYLGYRVFPIQPEPQSR